MLFSLELMDVSTNFRDSGRESNKGKVTKRK
jgi:hypothetical protein